MVPCLQTWMSMRWLAISCLSVVAACSSEDEGPISDAGPDEMPAFTGLTLQFVADAELPAMAGADVRIDDIYLNGSVIRAIGDATTGNEQPTTGHDHELHWTLDQQPRDLAFSTAPVGEYSYVELRLARHPGGARIEAYEIRGEARVDDEWTDFAIRAEVPAVIAKLPVSLRLEAGRPLTIPIELDVSRLVEGLDFGALPKRDGALVLDEQTPGQLSTFVGSLLGAFRVR